MSWLKRHELVVKQSHLDRAGAGAGGRGTRSPIALALVDAGYRWAWADSHDVYCETPRTRRWGYAYGDWSVRHARGEAVEPTVLELTTIKVDPDAFGPSSSDSPEGAS